MTKAKKLDNDYITITLILMIVTAITFFIIGAFVGQGQIQEAREEYYKAGYDRGFEEMRQSCLDSLLGIKKIINPLACYKVECNTCCGNYCTALDCSVGVLK